MNSYRPLLETANRINKLPKTRSVIREYIKNPSIHLMNQVIQQLKKCEFSIFSTGNHFSYCDHQSLQIYTLFCSRCGDYLLRNQLEPISSNIQCFDQEHKLITYKQNCLRELEMEERTMALNLRYGYQDYAEENRKAILIYKIKYEWEGYMPLEIFNQLARGLGIPGRQLS